MSEVNNTGGQVVRDVNNTVNDPRNNYNGRQPKTDTFIQPTGNRVLIRCTTYLSSIEIRGIQASFKKQDHIAIRDLMNNPIVCGYGDGTSQVELGDKILLGDNYSVIKVTMDKDIDDLINVLDRLNKLDKFNGVSNSIPPDTKHKVNLYFLIEEYVIIGREIIFPNV